MFCVCPCIAEIAFGFGNVLLLCICNVYLSAFESARAHHKIHSTVKVKGVMYWLVMASNLANLAGLETLQEPKGVSRL